MGAKFQSTRGGSSNVNDAIVANNGTGSNGTFSLSGGVLNFITGSSVLGGGFNIASGNTYDIFQDFSTSGNTVTGETLEMNGVALSGYTANISESGILSFQASAVPEPGTWAMLLVGMALLGFWRHRKPMDATERSA